MSDISQYFSIAPFDDEGVFVSDSHNYRTTRSLLAAVELAKRVRRDYGEVMDISDFWSAIYVSPTLRDAQRDGGSASLAGWVDPSGAFREDNLPDPS